MLPDPLSTSSALAGLVSLALQLTKTAAAFITDAAAFPKEFTRLLLVTNQFAVLLRHLNPSLEIIEERYETAGTPSIQAGADGPEKPDTLKHCTDVLGQIDTLLKSFKIETDNDSGIKTLSKPSLGNRIAWAFSKKQKAGELSEQLEHCKSTLELAFSNELLYGHSLGCVNPLDNKWQRKILRH